MGLVVPSVRGQNGPYDPNDPWPTYGHDERNSCRSPYRGPHCEPQLRWWAVLEPYWTPRGDTDDWGYHLAGAAVAKIDGVRRIVVSVWPDSPQTTEGRVFVFRFHPNDQDYDPQQGPASHEILLQRVGHPVNSTPLVVKCDDERSTRELVIVQTQGTVRCWDVSTVNPSKLYIPIWKVWLSSGSSSPTLGYPTRDAQEPQVYAQGVAGNQGVVCGIDPVDGTILSQTHLEPWVTPSLAYAHQSSPAIGPVEGDALNRNFAYAVTYDGEDAGDPHFFAVYADGSSATQAWGHNVYHGLINVTANMGSPGVFDFEPQDISTADVATLTDEGYLWGFDNVDYDGTLQPDAAWFPNPYDPCPLSGNISSTAAITTDRAMIFSTEGQMVGGECSEYGHRIYLYRWGEEHAEHIAYPLLGTNRWVFGAPVLDSWGRFFMATPSVFGPDNDGRRVFGYRLLDTEPDGEWDSFDEEWRFPFDHAFLPEPPLGPGVAGYPGYSAPLAMDEDGTLLCVGFDHPDGATYIIALRPLVADFNGDGVVSNFDIDPFVHAITDYEYWEYGEHVGEEWLGGWGQKYGINLLGIGDANNDGLFNNFDIDPIVEIIVGAGDGAGDGGGNPDWLEYLYEVQAWLHEYFGMEDC